MNREEELEGQVEGLRERLSRLSEASLRINETLDLDMVLQGVLDSACSLTGARYGVIALFDQTGCVQDFLISGLSLDEQQALLALPEGPELFGYLGSISGSLRLSDLHRHTKAVGLPEFHLPMAVSPQLPFLASPVIHLGERVGAVYLADRKGGSEFSREDEETLVMFASQAAMVIANARRYQEEQRARADLETLINTSPVGVIVINAMTGTVGPFNQEVVRLQGLLGAPDRPLEELLEVLTVRRADGREVSLQELSMAQALSTGETVRAEEVVFEVPDGRSVAVLMNATPIRSKLGEVETFVVVLQDLTPMQELERQRAEFLGQVSHELRTPLTSVKGSITTLLDPSTALNPAETLQFHRIIDAQTDRMRELIADLLDVARIDTGTLSVSPEPMDAVILVDEARSTFLSGGSRNILLIDLAPELPRVMADRLRIVQVMTNLLSNAARHSPDTSDICMRVKSEGVHVSFSVSDEGSGMRAEVIPQLFRKHTRIDGDDLGEGLAGSGLGLAICKGIVEAHGGRIWAESAGPGQGARFTFTLPTVDEKEIFASAAPTQLATRGSRRAPREQVRILVVDDDPQALRYVRDALAKAGYQPLVTGDHREVPRLLEEERPHLVLLDLVLPGTDGVELMGDIMAIADVPVIFLSAYGQEQLIVRAFDAGAADYIVKPFSPTELAARIRAALRKRATPEPSEPYVLGPLTIDFATRQVTFAGNPIRLTAIEYRTLTELAINAGRVLTYDHLLQRVWGVDGDGDLRPMRTVISTLRRRLNDNADNPTFIFTEPRIGYRMPKGEGPMPWQD